MTEPDLPDPPAAGSVWPDIAVRVEVGRIVPRWIATSVHPELGPLTGSGISREGAVRALARHVRRRRFVASEPEEPVTPPAQERISP